MPKWTDYTTKTEPADNDEVMILDTAGKANKRLGLSALSDWIIGKIANKVFENLQTQNKTVLGAINELNSNTCVAYIESSSASVHDVKIAFKKFPQWTNFAMLISIYTSSVIAYLSVRESDIAVYSITTISGSLDISASGEEVLISNVPAYAGGMCISPKAISISIK